MQLIPYIIQQKKTHKKSFKLAIIALFGRVSSIRFLGKSLKHNKPVKAKK